MKKLISKDGTFIKEIGKTLYIEEYNDGTEFYCLLDKYGNFNIADTGKTYKEIKTRIDLWKDLVYRHVITIR